MLGYVDFESVRDAEDAKHATDRRSVNGKPAMDVTFAPPLRSAAPAGGGGRGPPPDRASYRDDRQPYGGGGAGGAPPQSNPYASLSYDPAAASRYEPGPVGGYAGGRRDEPYRGRDRPRDEWRRDGPRDGGRDGRREPPPAPRGREPRREDGPPRRWLGTKPRMPAALPIPEGDALKAPSAVLYAANLPTDASEREISRTLLLCPFVTAPLDTLSAQTSSAASTASRRSVCVSRTATRSCTGRTGLTAP